MDPIIDRLTVISGCVVCWHFDLLPKWGLAIVVAREVVDPGDAPRSACAAASTSRSTGSGRIGVFFVMAGIFWALAVEGWVPEALFVFGLVAAIAASFVYVRAGFARLRERSPTQGLTQPSTSGRTFGWASV